MGWGIRGQFGHESGAMIAGALAATTLVMLFAPHLSSLGGARAAAMMTVAIGLGGSMTYGQTVGLTHDAELIGHWGALRWGMLGLFVKGGLWIGFAATFLGMGLGAVRYTAREMALLMAALFVLSLVGATLINAPFDPAEKQLPWIYFSDHWHFEPDRDLKPRQEMWGGLLLALGALVLYTRGLRRDRLAGRMALAGILAGGLGFAGGQSVQAFRRWSPEVFTEGYLAPYAEVLQHVNWWNTMETTFGVIFGAGLAIGLWWNRHLIRTDDPPPAVSIAPRGEALLVALHLALLLIATFADLSGIAGHVDLYVDHGLLMAALPLIGIVGGRAWPYLLLLPVTAAPIVGKTVRQVCYRTDLIDLTVGWITLVALPVVLMTAVAALLIRRSSRDIPPAAGPVMAVCLLATTWVYFALNTVIFEFAWPWNETWTTRTPHQAIFAGCTGLLTVAAIFHLVRTARAT